MSFWTPQALGALAQSESGGNPSLIHYPSGYTPSGARSSASGLYGYLDSTWRTYAPQAGVDITQYPRAYLAPASVQNQVALITPTSNWTCPGCNARASQLATDPANVSGTPSLDGASVIPVSGPLPPGAQKAITGHSPDTGAPLQLGLQPGLLSDLQNWINSLATGFTTAVENWFGAMINWFVRGFLIIVGLVIAAIALFAMMERPQEA